MNKQEILDEINKTKEYLANMEKMLEECEYKRWQPKDGEKYWYITNTNQLSQIDFTSERSYKREDDYQRWLTYNCFQTREQAEQEAEKILVRRILEDIARRLNKGQKIDWSNPKPYKYSLCFNFYENKIDYLYCSSQKEQGVVYCLSIEFYKVAIQEIGKKRLENYLKGE